MKTILAAVALLASTCAFGGATSVNVFGVLKVLSTTTNTIVTIPWTDYSQVQKNAEPIFSPKLVKPTNLTEGDTILWHRGDGKFDSWILNGHQEWEKAVTVASVPFGTGSSTDLTEDGVRISRGYGFWLQRQRPFDIVDGKKVPVPFWLFGQAVTNISSAVIGGGSIENPCCTMLANPWGGKVKLNELGWKDVYEGKRVNDLSTCDTLIVPNGFNGSDYIYRMNGKWTYSQIVSYEDKYKDKDGVIRTRKRSRTEYVTDITIPAGQGFWYVRRKSEPTTLDWPINYPEQEPVPSDSNE